MNLQFFMAEDFMLNDSFVRYCLQSNEEDVAFWNDWIARNPHKQAETDKAREWVLRLGIKLNAEQKLEEFNKLRAMIEIDHEVATRRRNYIPYVAAAVLAGCMAFVWMWKKQSTDVKLPAIAYKTYRADSARKQIVLADGTTVILNRNSVLQVPENYNQQDRHLILSGEALCDVQKDDTRPFTVSAGNTRVQVLGTVFKVRAYLFDSSVKVSLLSGKVKVAAADASKELLPGETLEAQDGRLIPGNFDVAREQDWRRGRLFFRDASLIEVAAELENWYGIKVHITPGKYPAIHFNGEFMNKSLPEVLASISYITNLKTVIQKDELFINH